MSLSTTARAPLAPQGLQTSTLPYIHGYSLAEQQRLRTQARILEPLVHGGVDFSGATHLLEVGCGVGAQTEILLRRFPHLFITGLDFNPHQLAAAEERLSRLSHAQGRHALHLMDGARLSFESHSFDGAFLCWVLEHVPDPRSVLAEVRRVLRPGSRLYVAEALNSSLLCEPDSPGLRQYWRAFNDYQLELGGDPFMGARLSTLLHALGYQEVRTEMKTWSLASLLPDARRELFTSFWLPLLLSAADPLLAHRRVTPELVQQVSEELHRMQGDPDAVLLYSSVHASAVVR